MHDGLTPSNSIDDDLISKQIKELEKEKLILENLSKDKNYFMSADEMISLKEKSAKIARLKKSKSNKTETSITQIIDNEIEVKAEQKIDSKNVPELKTDLKSDDKESINNTTDLPIETHVSLLKKVKLSHSKWVSHVHLLIEHGILSKEKDNIQENYTLCDFGKWYYNEGQNLLYFDEFKNLEPIHKKLHKSYSKIYRIFSKKKKFKLFGNDKNLTKLKFKKAHHELNKIDKCSEEIIHNINLLIEILYSLTNKEFQTISKQS